MTAAPVQEFMIKRKVSFCSENDAIIAVCRPNRDTAAETRFTAFAANSKQAPQIVDRQVQPILDQSEVYSGCYGRVSITFYAYNSNGNKGIAAGLGNVQKLRDGEPLGSRANAKDEFEAVDAEDDFLA